MSENLLKPVDDGLVMRSSQEYARDKLRIIDGYTQRMVTSMRERPWRAMFYIDLEAGPGKNLFPSGGDIESGSPLIGLGANYPFTHYRFIEIDKRNCDALKKRVASSELHRQAKVFHGDCNVLVDEITREIQEIDRPFIHGKWHSLNLAILDPEGLEMHWETVEKLGRMKRMDLIFTFWTSGITRNANSMLASGDTGKIDRMFGSDEWQQIYKSVANKTSTVKRRALIDHYKSRLNDLGYKIGSERVFHNSKNVQVYTMFGASKHDLGIKFWDSAIKGLPQSRLFGF